MELELIVVLETLLQCQARSCQIPCQWLDQRHCVPAELPQRRLLLPHTHCQHGNCNIQNHNFIITKQFNWYPSIQSDLRFIIFVYSKDFLTFIVITSLANLRYVIGDITFAKNTFLCSQLKRQFAKNALKGIFKLCTAITFKISF